VDRESPNELVDFRYRRNLPLIRKCYIGAEQKFMGESSSRETKVGILLILGIGLICSLILLLGEMPDLFKPTYCLTLQLSDASGLVKGANVNLCGALIGKVVTVPQIVPHTDTTEVKVRIEQNVPIQRDAKWTVNNSGFFGDAFLEVQPQTQNMGEEKSPVLASGDTVQGVPGINLTTLMKASLPLIRKANHAAAQLDNIVTRLNTEVLTKATCEDLKKTANALPKLIDDSHGLVENANGLIAGVKSGRGALGELLYNSQVKANLAKFLVNLKEHGVLFYSDDSAIPHAHVKARPSWRARP
jgi:phospholipid/cholesterol/gamma-HCH transport system substrate-binding protein